MSSEVIVQVLCTRPRGLCSVSDAAIEVVGAARFLPCALNGAVTLPLADAGGQVVGTIVLTLRIEQFAVPEDDNASYNIRQEELEEALEPWRMTQSLDEQTHRKSEVDQSWLSLRIPCEIIETTSLKIMALNDAPPSPSSPSAKWRRPLPSLYPPS